MVLYRVSTQRAQYKLWEEGKKRACTLTKDRVKRLNKLGFVSDFDLLYVMLFSAFLFYFHANFFLTFHFDNLHSSDSHTLA